MKPCVKIELPRGGNTQFRKWCVCVSVCEGVCVCVCAGQVKFISELFLTQKTCDTCVCVCMCVCVCVCVCVYLVVMYRKRAKLVLFHLHIYRCLTLV